MREGLTHWQGNRESNAQSPGSVLSRFQVTKQEVERNKKRLANDYVPTSREPHDLSNTFRFLDDIDHERPSVDEIERSTSRSTTLFDEIALEVRYAADVKGASATEYWASVVTAWKGLATAAERRFSTPLGNLSRERRRILAATLTDISKVTTGHAGRAIAVVALWLEAQALIPIPKVKAASTMAATVIEGCIEATQ